MQDVGEEARGVAVDVGTELVQRHGGVGAEREEGGGAEVHVAAVAAEDVPGGRQHDVLQDDVAGEEHVVVAQAERGQEEDEADAEGGEEEGPGAHHTSAPGCRRA